MADIILPGKIRPLASSLEPDLDALSDHERLALGKQQRLTDALKVGRLELDADRRFGEAFDALKQDGGVSAPDFVSRADGAGDRIMQEIADAIPGEVSDGAREAFLRTLDSRRKDYDLDIDALRGVTRTRDGLALVEDMVGRAVETVQREPFRLKARLDDFDRVAGDMGTALAPLREDALQDRRAAIVTAAVKSIVAQGQGDKALLLLDSGVLGDRLGADRLARLKETTKSLTRAYDQDRQDAEQRTAREDSRARQAKAHAVSADIRTRIGDGEAIETEIAAAETEGVLSRAQANRLRAEATAARDRQDEISARANRVTSILDSGNRPNPQDSDTRDDVAHHYDTTVKPTLAGLDPARKAAAIAGYVTETGIAPDPALDTLLALTATGDPASRIAAAREFITVLAADPTARGWVPPILVEYAETVVQIADLDALTPGDIVTHVEKVFGVGNADPDGPSPALIYLAMGMANDGDTEGDWPEIGEVDDFFFDDIEISGLPVPEGDFSGEERILLQGVADGDPVNQNAAAHEILSYLNSNPAARNTLPAALINRAELLADRVFVVQRSSDSKAEQRDTALSPTTKENELGTLHEGALPVPPTTEMTDLPGVQGEDVRLQVSQNNQGRYSIDLARHETAGGHTIRNHVGKSPNQLMRRASQRFRIGMFERVTRRAGSFSSLDAATRLINATLSQNRSIVDQVVSGSERDAFITSTFESKTGIEAYRSSSKSQPFLRDTFGVGVFIIRDMSLPEGFRIISAYPRND